MTERKGGTLFQIHRALEDHTAGTGTPHSDELTSVRLRRRLEIQNKPPEGLSNADKKKKDRRKQKKKRRR